MEELLNDLRDRIRPMKKPTDLSNGDQPRVSLVANLLNGSNFMNWSKAIKFALGAKSKLGFIDGKIPKPTTGDDEIELWIRTDLTMATSDKFLQFALGAKSMLGLITGSSSLPATGDEARELWFKADFMELENLNRPTDEEALYLNNNYLDLLFLSNSDAPGAQLGPALFTGNNFLTWSHGVQNAIGAKFKIGFIDGTCLLPIAEGEDLARWIRTDYMVRCWIINSMTKGFASGFCHVSSAKELWTELQESIDPIVYCHCAARTSCNCEILNHMTESDNPNRILDFLLGLNDAFEVVRGQILSLDSGEATSPGSSSSVNTTLFLPFVKKSSRLCQLMLREFPVVFDPGGFKPKELELLVVLGALHLFDEMPCISVLVCELSWVFPAGQELI